MKKFAKYLCMLAALLVVACDDQPTGGPDGPDTPTDPNAVTMTDIEILDMQGTYADFAVIVRNMDSFGYMVIPTEEYTEKTVAEVIAGSGQYSLDDGNFSWEEDMTIVFGVDTTPSTDYTVVAAAKNSTSEVLKITTFTTPEEAMEVNKITFSPTKLAVTHSGNDHYLMLTTALYEMCIHLTSEGFGGRYDNLDDNEALSFVADGSYFRVLEAENTYTEYNQLDTSIGNIDLYENVMTGLWEVYGSFCFASDDSGDKWLTIEIEIPSGKVIAGAERTEPFEFNLDLTKVTAAKNESNPNQWELVVTQDKDNTITFNLDLGENKEFIPSGTYSLSQNMTSCSMIVNNVTASAANFDGKITSVTVEYNEQTEETYVSALVWVKSGTAVVKIDHSGPFVLYKEVITGTETFTEGEALNTMAIWATWYDNHWLLECFGMNFSINLYFMTGTGAADHLPAGRYYLSSTAPADGSMWIDITKSNAKRLKTDEASFQFIGDSADAYIDVTEEWDSTNEFWRHNIVGTLKSTNGAYIINLNYVKENGSIY